MPSKKIGIDLGTSTVLIYVKGEGIVVNEPSLVAVNRDGTRILAIGRQAQEMVGRTPDAIQIVRPMRDGVIADFVVTEGMLHHFIGKVQGRQRIFKPEIMICVPSGVTSVERRAVTEAAISAGARQAWLIDEPLAAAIGAGLPIAEPRGNAICDIGGGTTEIAVISLSGMVVAHSIRVGGNRFDDAIAAYLKRKHNLLVGERSAEELKINIGSAMTMKEPLRAEVKGRDIVSGLPRSLQVTSKEILHAMVVDRPDCRMTVFLPEGVSAQVAAPAIGYRTIPATRLVGRHIQWPARIRATKADAFFGPAGVLPLRDVGMPSVLTVHDLAIYRNAEWFPARQPLSTGWIVPRSLRRADALIAVSENTARDLEAIFDIPRERIAVVPEAVSSAFRPLGAEDLKEARQKLKLPDRFILFVSTIEPRKNLTTLLEAWAMMRDRPDLVVVGGWGWRYEPIRAQMERMRPRLRHIGGLDPRDRPAGC